MIVVAKGSDLPTDPAGEYGGRLSNSGEQLTLIDATGQSIQQFAYSDEWQLTTDGDGFSLETIDIRVTGEQLSLAQSWRPSRDRDGTPGRFVASEVLPGDFNQDQLVNRADVEVLYAAIAANSVDDKLDLTNDGIVNTIDVNFLVEELIGARPGDTNLDGFVDFADFLVLSANFGEVRQDLEWFDGDLNGDRIISFADFLLLSASFGESNGA